MHRRAIILLIASSVEMAAGGFSMAADIPELTSVTAPGGAFARAEWAVHVGRSYANPYDPLVVAVDAAFSGPGGSRVDVPAFWDERGSDRAFFVRFAPPSPGAWSMRVSVTDDAGTRRSPEVAFKVEPSSRDGFVRVAGNRRYLCFDSGRSDFLIGLNLCWPPPGDGGATWYEQTFKTLATNGGNYARVWMCGGTHRFETAKTGAGQYDPVAAAFFDKILAAGEASGVGVMLCFLNHREFLERDMWGPAEWPSSPYNAANGGPSKTPAAFFTSQLARQLFKNRLRYIVARYSAYTSVAFWEIFNEQENTKLDVPAAWNGEMVAYLNQIDPNRHLVTTSANVPAKVWDLPGIAMTQSHLYGDGNEVDLSTDVARAEASHETYGKPHLVGEIGLDYKGPDAREDAGGLGIAFHNSLWSSLASGSAGTSMYWWWDDYVIPKNLWRDYRAVAEFAGNIDWAHGNLEPVAVDVWHEHSSTMGAAVPALPADLVIATGGGWGDTADQTVVVPPNGRPNVLPPRYLYGPPHTDLTRPLEFDVDLPNDCLLKFGIGKVSDLAVVRVAVDHKAVRDFAFSALPGAAEVAEAAFDKDSDRYQSQVNKTYELPVPAGKHRITLTVAAGDWVTLTHVTFTHALPARYANLAAWALQDNGAGRGVVWILDTRSNWKDDQARRGPPPANGDVRLSMPMKIDGAFTCEWFDTRTGRSVRKNSAAATAGVLTLNVPSFVRDIALRITSTK